MGSLGIKASERPGGAAERPPLHCAQSQSHGHFGPRPSPGRFEAGIKDRKGTYRSFSRAA